MTPPTQAMLSSRLLAMASLVLLQTGCATILEGSDPQKVEVRSSPSGAGIYADGKELGKTPTTLTLERKEDHNLEFRLDGYQPTTIKVEKKFNKKSLLNIPLCLIPLPLTVIGGFVVDLVTGAIYKLEPAEVSAQLSRSGAQEPWSDGDVYVFVTLEPADPNWELVERMEPIEE